MPLLDCCSAAGPELRSEKSACSVETYTVDGTHILLPGATDAVRSLQLLLGAGLALVFTAVCAANMSRAIKIYVVVASIPFIRVLTLAGNDVSQSLLMVHLMATVLIAVWVLQERTRGSSQPLILAAFERPLLMLPVVAVLSLVSSRIWHDPQVDARHIKLSVSIGQILLMIWAAGSYLVVANTIRRSRSIRWIHDAIIVLGIPTLALPFLHGTIHTYVAVSMYFAITASPFCLSQVFHTRSNFQKAGLLLLAFVPLAFGVAEGKAFLYIYVLVSSGFIVSLHSRRLLWALLPVAAGIYLMLVVPGWTGIVPAPIEDLLNVERQQQSWDGKAGRVQLAVDAIEIWRHFPVLGVGPGNSWPYMHRYSSIDTPHNQYLNILLEFGVAGLACFVAFIVLAMQMGLRLRKRVRDPFHEMFVVGWLGLFAGMTVASLTGDFMIHSIRNGGLEMMSGFYLQWVVLGLVTAIDRIEERRALNRSFRRRGQMEAA
jgi:O-antigen ligase